jgi:hypothetical protein
VSEATELAPDRAAAPLAWFVAALLALVAILLLPWPLSPLAGTAWLATPLAAWAALEAAFLLPLLRDLTADEGARIRAASREAQMGAGGRIALWLAASGSAWLAGGWADGLWPARVLLGTAATLALPLAGGWEPFGPERSVEAAMASPSTTERLVVALRRAALIALVALAWAPAGTLALPAASLGLALLLGALLALALRALGGRFPRMPLPHALQLCWLAALPLALASMVYLAYLRP